MDVEKRGSAGDLLQVCCISTSVIVTSHFRVYDNSEQFFAD